MVVTMTIPLVERGDYYRGLLVLIRRDRVITARERELMIKVGRSLDFDTRFCESAIDDLLNNPHIKAVPMKFEDKETAESFVRDAIRLAQVDGEVHPKELAWLKAVVRENGLKNQWLYAEIKKLQKSEPSELLPA